MPWPTSSIQTLAELDDDALFRQIADGCALILTSVEGLERAWSCLAKAGHHHAADLVALFAQEEASKALVLVDVARCPRQPADRWMAQVRRFDKHLAKGLYARACDMAGVNTLGELQRVLDGLRLQRFLDGPNDVDWLFGNEVEGRRNSYLYVDFVGDGRDHYWASPLERYEPVPVSHHRPAAVTLAFGLAKLGVTSFEGLRILAETWRPWELGPETRRQEVIVMNNRTFEQLRDCGISPDSPNTLVQEASDMWLPLYALDLSLVPVKESQLRDQQKSWSPD